MTVVHNSTKTVGESAGPAHSEFPQVALAGELLGVTNDGHGVYVQNATAQLWSPDGESERTTTYLVTEAVPRTDAHDEFATVLCPPTGQDLTDASATLTGGIDALGAYILEVAQNRGEWQVLTDRGWRTLAVADIDTQEIDVPYSTPVL